MKENWVYRRGDLYLANLGVPVGSKQGGVRPVVVLQNDVGNYYAPTITIAPLTSKIEKKRKQPTHFFLRKAKGLAKPSMVLAEQLDTCDKICVIRYLGRVSKGQMRGIDEAVRIQLGYYIPEQVEKKRQGKCRKEGEEGDGQTDYKEGSSQYTGNQRKNTGCCKNRRFDLLCSVCGKRLLMQSAQIRMTTLIDYTSKVKNLALLAVVYQNFSLQCFAKGIRWSYTLDFSVFSG